MIRNPQHTNFQHHVTQLVNQGSVGVLQLPYWYWTVADVASQNLTPYAFQCDLRAPKSQPGCGDFCFIWSDTLQKLQKFLSDLNIPVELGPVTRTGGRAAGTVPGQSVYIRDPDSNLLEFIVYPDKS